MLNILLDGELLTQVVYSTRTIETLLRDLAEEGLAEEADDMAPFGTSTATRSWVLTDAGRAAQQPR